MTIDDIVLEIETELKKLFKSKKPKTKSSKPMGLLFDLIDNAKSVSDVTSDEINNTVNSIFEKYQYSFKKGEKGAFNSWLKQTLIALSREQLT